MAEETPTFFNRIKIEGNPLANPESMIVCGMARFTILTPRLLRMEWSATGQFEDRGTFAFPNRYASATTFSYERDGNRLEIQTGVLVLHYIDNGQPFDSSNLSIRFELNGQSVNWTPGLHNDGNLRGTKRTLDQCADVAELSEGLLSRDGWSLFDDSQSPVWDRTQTWVEGRPDHSLQDWYFFGYGHDYKAALGEYIQFGGAIPLIPRYVLGGWWSRFWAYHADDLKQLVNDFKAHDVPLDVLVIDMDWHTPDGWTGYTWNRNLFPDPEAFLAWVHQQGLAATLNLHPAEGVQKHEAVYPEFMKLLGRDAESGEGIKFNCADKTFIQHYFELLHHPMEEQGVDFWWLDWQQGESTDIRGLDPLAWLNHLHFRDAARRGKRSMLYSRWGGLGNHRYPIGFSGDTYATWESLRFQSYFTPTATNVVYGWWSHDIGGHFGATDPELYARWVQFGAVSPCLRLHSTKDPLAERRPWAFDTPIYEAAKSAMQFRYRLLPYLYSTARDLSQRGLSLCYPMYYDYPEAEDAYLAREQYFLGDQLFVAPITRPTDPETGLAAVNVWIPDGTWIEYTTLEAYTGPQWVQVQAALNRIPMFVKAGAILPMAPQIMRTRDFDGSQIILELFPQANGEFTLYEDDGTTEGYKRGEYETTEICTALSSENTLLVQINPSQGKCAALPATRTFELHVRGISQPNRVTINGTDYSDWSYDKTSTTLVLILKDTQRYTQVDVVVNTQQLLNALIADAQPHEPLITVVDYGTFADAKQQLGTVIVAPANDGSPFDVEIEWNFKNGYFVSSPTRLKHCTARQIIHSPFNHDGTCHTFQWSAVVRVTWNGRTIEQHYRSEATYPAINQWHTLIYDPQMQPLGIEDVLLDDGNLNTGLLWTTVAQTVEGSLNVKQPFGVILLETERERIIKAESLEACLSTTILSHSPQDAVLLFQSVGDATVYLNGNPLTLTEPVNHDKLQPMFPSWMPPKQTYYALPLQQGANQLVVFTHPDESINWWGIGATVYSRSGSIIPYLFPQKQLTV